MLLRLCISACLEILLYLVLKPESIMVSGAAIIDFEET